MDVSDAVQWWEEWQLRILVLGSLFLRYFLYFAAPLRKHCIPSWFRFIIWLAYLGNDALAIYALAVLFNRHKKQEWVSAHREDASLEALWAPILLVHLGGVDAITAYNIEDNELWRRHILTSLSQTAVAIYVFQKSWSGDKGLLGAAILIFLAGFLKCFEKPVALKSASISSLMNTISPDTEDDYDITDELYYPFVDMAPRRFGGRGEGLQTRRLVRGCKHDDLRTALSFAFHRLYTKEQVSSTTMKFICHITDLERLGRRRVFGYLLRLVVNPMIFTALGLFHTSHRRRAYNSVDVKYSLIGYLASKRKHRFLTSITAFLGCEDYLDPLWCKKPWKSSHHITRLVKRFMKNWKEVATNMAFNDNRGQWTITNLGCGGSKILWESIGRPFDESVLLWHLATEFCYFDRGGGDSRYDHDTSTYFMISDCKQSRVISNYMAHLLFVNPEMLMTGARPSLFRNAYKRLRAMLLDDHYSRENLHVIPQDDGGKEANKIIQKLKGGAKVSLDSNEKKGGAEGRGVVEDAWELSEELMKLCNDDNDKMWKVIFGVWVEMLCFSASRCRGYLHAKSLGKGGEYLSYIWLLMWRMGMETLADKMQRAPEMPKQEDDSASGGGAEINDTTSTTLAKTIIGDENEKAEPQEVEGSNDGTARTTSPATVISDEKRDEDDVSHGATSAAAANPIIGDEIV